MGFIIIIISFASLTIPLLTNILKQNVDYIIIFFGDFSGIVLNFIDETLGKPINEIIPEENENNLKDSILKFEKYRMFSLFLQIKLNQIIFYFGSLIIKNILFYLIIII